MAKKLLDMTVFLGLLGPASVKAACRMLMKLTPVYACVYRVFDERNLFVVSKVSSRKRSAIQNTHALAVVVNAP